MARGPTDLWVPLVAGSSVLPGPVTLKVLQAPLSICSAPAGGHGENQWLKKLCSTRQALGGSGGGEEGEGENMNVCEYSVQDE